MLSKLSQVFSGFSKSPKGLLKAKQSVRTKVFFVPEMKTKQMFRTLCFALAPSLAVCSENILAPKLVLVLFISSWAWRMFQSHPLQATLFFFLLWAEFILCSAFIPWVLWIILTQRKSLLLTSERGVWEDRLKIVALIQKAKGLGKERKGGGKKKRKTF